MCLFPWPFPLCLIHLAKPKASYILLSVCTHAAKYHWRKMYNYADWPHVNIMYFSLFCSLSLLDDILYTIFFFFKSLTTSFPSSFTTDSILPTSLRKLKQIDQAFPILLPHLFFFLHVCPPCKLSLLLLWLNYPFLSLQPLLVLESLPALLHKITSTSFFSIITFPLLFYGL